MVTHLAAVLVFVVPLFGNVIGPLIVWLVFKDDDPFLDRQGREAVNFQITVALIVLVLGGVTAFLSASTAFGLFFVFPLLALAWIALAAVTVGAIAYTVIAAVKAYHGEMYHYPLAFRFVPSSSEAEGSMAPTAPHSSTGPTWTEAEPGGQTTDDDRLRDTARAEGRGHSDGSAEGPGPTDIDAPPRGPSGP